MGQLRHMRHRSLHVDQSKVESPGMRQGRFDEGRWKIGVLRQMTRTQHDARLQEHHRMYHIDYRRQT